MSEQKNLIFDPTVNLPFHTYRRFFADGTHPLFDLAPSLLHHYESEKFRGTDETIRLSILDAPSAKAVQKISKKNRALWRADWRTVRGRVLRAGLAMQVMQSKSAMKMARAAFDQSMELTTQPRIAGLPGSFLSEEIQGFFQKVTGPTVTKLGVITLAGCVPDDIESRLNAIFLNARPISAAVYAGADCDTRVEQWCALAAVPVRLTSVDSRRLREEDASTVTARVTTLLTCMPKTRKGPQAILASAATKRPKVRILDYTITA